MRAYWQKASTREKQIIILGATFLGLLLLYKMTLGYLFNTTAELRDHYSDQQSQLSWMKITAQQIQAITHKTQKSEHLTIAALLNKIQNDMNLLGLSKNIVLLQESDSHSIELHLQHVPFDRFMTWLTTCTQEQNLIVTKASFTPETTPGVVSANLSLQMI